MSSRFNNELLREDCGHKHHCDSVELCDNKYVAALLIHILPGRLFPATTTTIMFTIFQQGLSLQLQSSR